MHMKEELRLWKQLYDTAIDIEKRDPWQKLGNAELLGIRYDRTTVYMNTVSEGEEKALFAYEGNDAYNSYLLMNDIHAMHVQAEFAADSQCALMAFWGKKEEVPKDQLKIIQELGLSFEENEWLYFLSQEEGTIPVIFHNEEIVRFTKYLKDYRKLYSAYIKKERRMDPFTEMYCLWYQKERTIRGFAALPFIEYQCTDLYLDDENTIEKIQDAGRNSAVLEISMQYMRIPVYEDDDGMPLNHPLNPLLGIIGDRIHQTVIYSEYGNSIGKVKYQLAQALIQYMKQNGVPEEVHVKDRITESAIRNICDVSDTELYMDERLPFNEDFFNNFIQYTLNQKNKKLS